MGKLRGRMRPLTPTEDNNELVQLRNSLRERTITVWNQGRHDEALEARDELAKEATNVLYRTLDSARKASSYLEVSAELLQLEGRNEEALADLFEATYLLNSHEVPALDLGRLNGALGTLLDNMGRIEEAKEHYRRAIEHFSKSSGEPIGVARVKNNLAMLVKSEGDIEGARKYYQEALEVVEAKESADEELAASVRYNYAVLLQQEGEDAASAELFDQSLEIRQRVLGDQHLDTATSHAAVAIIHALMGENTEALSHFAMAEPIMRENASKVREEYDALVENYCIFLRNIGLSDRADEVERVSSEVTPV